MRVGGNHAFNTLLNRDQLIITALLHRSAEGRMNTPNATM